MQAIDLPESRALLVALPPTVELVGRPEVAGAWASPSAVAGYTVGGSPATWPVPSSECW